VCLFAKSISESLLAYVIVVFYVFVSTVRVSGMDSVIHRSDSFPVYSVIVFYVMTESCFKSGRSRFENQLIHLRNIS
jgi:hypothetical protein